MSGLLLTRDERERFASWLEQSAANNKAMLEQMERIKAAPVLIEKTRIEAHAALIIARQLRSLVEEVL